MHPVSITQAFFYGLLASAPLAAALGSDVGVFEAEKRHVGSLASYASKMVRDVLPRHHTEAQIAAKEAAAAITSTTSTNTGCSNNKRQAVDEFGPWDTTEDEFGSWVDKREPHHTEAQIAAKEAAAASTSTSTTTTGACSTNQKRQAADEFGPWDTTEDEFGSWVDKREPHHTEAQIAAKEAAQGTSTSTSTSTTTSAGACFNQKREAHHTEAQIAAKEAAQGSSSTSTTC